LVWW
jgi:hypothetical protein